MPVVAEEVQFPSLDDPVKDSNIVTIDDRVAKEVDIFPKISSVCQ